ncbi:MAG: cyclopropane-fatty-acyl-phospholipid synthase family protein [Pseudomonadota bacterium]
MKITAFSDTLQLRSGNVGWWDKLARKIVFRILNTIEFGSLRILEEGDTQVFGNSSDDLPVGMTEIKATITVHHPSFYRCIAQNGSIGAAEAYIAELWSTNDLTSVVQLLCRNMSQLEKIDGGLTKFANIASLIRHRHSRNSRRGSKDNIHAHYDLSNDLFALFLDERMMYSSAVFASDQDSLEQASLHKLELLAEKLQLQRHHHVIEIGSGWGGMATHLAQQYGCNVTTTTISREQYEYTREKVKQLGLQDKITVLDQDYRDLTGEFDRLISVEMIEAVGHEYFSTFFAKCNELVKQGGRMVLQAITVPEQRYDYAKKNVDFIQRYIFPGGCLPSLEVMLQCTGNHTRFQLDQLQDIGLDYAGTLKHWRERFHASIPDVEKLGFDKAFQRLWEFYLCYCEGGFRERAISTVQVSFRKV